MIQILLADDHPAVRRALRRILETEKGWVVSAEAADGDEAVALAVAHRPDVVILDLVMPRLGGIEAARRIRAILPGSEIAIVTLTVPETSDLVEAAIAAGVRAFLNKSKADEHLVPAIRALAQHRSYFPEAARQTRLAS